MRHRRLAVPDVILLETERFGGERGFFSVIYNEQSFNEVGRKVAFVQDNQSRSMRNVIRGLHYQVERPQEKLIWVLSGAVFDVAVDLRISSPTYGKWVGEVLSAENGRQLWIPAGFAHGFLAMSEIADLTYKVTSYWSPSDERCIRWDDPALAVDWPMTGPAIVSTKDQGGDLLKTATSFA